MLPARHDDDDDDMNKLIELIINWFRKLMANIITENLFSNKLRI